MGYGIRMSDTTGSLTGGLAGLVVVAVVLVILDVSLLSLLPLAVAAAFLIALLVREARA